MKKNHFLLVSVFSLFSLVNAQSNKTAADNWIKENSGKIGALPQSQFKISNFRAGNTGETIRYHQNLNGVPVYQSEVLVHYNRNNALTLTDTESLKKISYIDTVPAISAQNAYDTAFQASHSAGEVTHQENNLYVYLTDKNETKLVYRVVINSFNNPGSWETIVDAKSGDVISVKDIAIYYKKHSHNGDGDDKTNKKKSEEPKAVKATGTGYVFDPDPLGAAHVAYGGQYVDGNDATNASLDAARKFVTIPQLEFAGGVYRLKGTYVDIRDLETPSKGLFTQASPDFLFNRNQDGFEAVNAYWHLSNSLTYINETLGIPCISMYNGGILLYDPSGLDGDDNSYYSAGRLVFGEGCVDDAEDADVVLHELGHGIHDWITNGSLSQVQGLSEGSGDYWAQSYSRSLNQWLPNEPAYQYMFSWDGHNTCWGGRTTNYSGNYPPSAGTPIHTAGQIWATALMKIYDLIGKEKTDRIFLEGLSMTTSSSNQQQAAIAARQAALDMVGSFGFTCTDVETITQQFTAKGYVLPNYSCTMAVADTKDAKFSIFPNPVTDKITIVTDAKADEVEIITMDGRKVMSAPISKQNNTINVSSLAKGIYFIKAKGTNLSQKFIKN